jgi:hypothetical protein
VKKFLNHMLKPMAIVSCIPVIGMLSYSFTHRKDLLATSLILWLGLIIGSAIKYICKDKSNESQ